MMQMLGAVLGLVMALVLGTNMPGKPEVTPVHNQNESSQIGYQVSEEAKNQEKNMNSGIDEPGNPGEEEQNMEEVSAQNGSLSQNHYADTKVPAYNVKSDKEMPTLIPQVAVDKSPALEESSDGDDQAPDPENINGQEGIQDQTQAQFGLSVANDESNEAKENKAAFGEGTAQNGLDNGKSN